jgi:hypothetical protein
LVAESTKNPAGRGSEPGARKQEFGCVPFAVLNVWKYGCVELYAGSELVEIDSGEFTGSV